MPVALAKQRLPALQQLRGEFAALDRVRGLRELLDPPFEGAQQSPGRAGQTSLKHGLGEFHRRLIVQSAAVVLIQVLRRAVVEILLAAVASAQFVRERAAFTLRVERLAVDADHFLLRAAKEVPVAGRLGGTAYGFHCPEGVGIEQSPEPCVGEALAHVRCSGKQQQMPGSPAEPAKGTTRVGADSQRFGQLVSESSLDPDTPFTHAQLVGLVENDKVVGRTTRSAKSLEHGLPCQGVHGDDDAIASCAAERVAPTRVGAGDDPEVQPKQGLELPPPVAHETRGRHDQHPFQTPTRQHLADVQAGHDRLPGAGVVGEQEPQRILLQHPLVDREALMQQRINE